jgi:sialic acid synthase SpsE
MKIIAELCQNHLGRIENLEEMVNQATENGAAYAKIQGLYSEEITKRPEFENPSGALYRPYDQEFARLKNLDLSVETEKWFVDYCLRKEIIPMITVFTHRGVERAKQAGFKHIKIASYDCASVPLIRNCLDFCEEIVISTGATYWKEIEKTAEMIRKNQKKNQHVALLHARTIYPTRLDNFGILKMTALSVFGFKFGLSDHTKPSEYGLIASKIAILLGASYIERHFTILDKSETRDGPISITPIELKDLSNFCELTKSEQLSSINVQDLQSALLCDSLEPAEEELVNRSYYRGRVASIYEGKHVYSWEEAPIEE